jgi:hypothetical protein
MLSTPRGQQSICGKDELYGNAAGTLRAEITREIQREATLPKWKQINLSELARLVTATPPLRRVIR